MGWYLVLCTVDNVVKVPVLLMFSLVLLFDYNLVKYKLEQFGRILL